MLLPALLSTLVLGLQERAAEGSAASPEDRVRPAGASALPPVAERAEDVRPLLPGSEIPSASVRRADGEPFDLARFVAEGPTVVVFYRGGWCPYCTRQLGELRGRMGDLQALGYRVLAISPDLPEYAVESAKAIEPASGFVLASDSSMEAARAFRVAFDPGAELFDDYRDRFELDLNQRSGRDHTWLPVPAVFVVGDSGRVDFQYVNPIYQVRLHPDVLMAAARAAVE